MILAHITTFVLIILYCTCSLVSCTECIWSGDAKMMHSQSSQGYKLSSNSSNVTFFSFLHLIDI